MNGATADPWLKTINAPKISNIIIVGNNQYFFLTLIKFQNSIKKLIIKIDYSYCYLNYLCFPSTNYYYFYLILKYLFQKSLKLAQ